jgi:hypothetical protein
MDVTPGASSGTRLVHLTTDHRFPGRTAKNNIGDPWYETYANAD